MKLNEVVNTAKPGDRLEHYFSPELVDELRAGLGLEAEPLSAADLDKTIPEHLLARVKKRFS